MPDNLMAVQITVEIRGRLSRYGNPRPGSFDYLRIPRHYCRNGNLEHIWIPTPRHSRRNGNPEPFSHPTRFVSAGMFQLGRQPVYPAHHI